MSDAGKLPGILSVWEHRDGDFYSVLHIANDVDTREYPRMIIYQSASTGTVWATRADDWHRSMTEVIVP